ncbi:uncharacterized protein [Miscanthus floridulus]|uniref:uncharacterized protein isoform X2 n=1 Tax=Miscanthus floridulus TaxID=154761 RepID=UPI00345A9777
MDADAAAAPCRKPASHSLPQPPLLFAVRARSGRVAGGAAFSGPPDTPPPPALFAVRARSGRLADLGGAVGAAFSGPPDTPPRPSLVTVPFLWEEAPGMPKASPTACAAATTPAATDAGPVLEGETGDHQDSSGHADQAARPLPLKLPPRLQQVPASLAALDTRQGSGHADQARPLPLKLPPRLQQVSASFAAADTPLSSPSTVFQGPYYARAGGGRRTPRWARSGGAALRRTTSAGVALFSRTWSKRRAAAPAAGRNKHRCGYHERDAAGTDAQWCSPGSSDSSSSVSTCFGGDDHRRGRPNDGREVSSEEDDGSPRGSVRITRFRLRRNRSLPSMSTSNLWAAADWFAGALRVLAKPQSSGPMADEAVADEAVADEATCLAEAARQCALALDQHEADHAALWAQATAVLNIKALIPVTLDSAANNFSKWRGLFLVVLGKYALTRHVLYDEALSDRPVWVRMDCTVLTWIYGTVSNDLLQSLMIHLFNARGAWQFLEDEFQNHSESRVLLLETQFRNLRQGSMSVGDYCRRLETMAAALGEFGDPISDRQMVLTLLHGLNSKFRHMVSNLKMRRPFPTFAEARTHLQLEEIDLEAAPPSPPAAMVADPPPRPTGPVGPPSSRLAGPSNPNGPRHNYNNNCRRGRGGKSSAPGSSLLFAPGGATSPHSSFAHPWVGTMLMWPYDHSPVVTPRPPPAMAATTLGTFGFPPYGHPGPYYGGASGAPPLQQFASASLPPQQQMMPSPLHPQQPSNPMQGGSWDQPSLANSFSTMALDPASAPSEWNVDSGEGSHITSDAGHANQEHDHQV